ncbi:MAG: bifunctional methylenetetrahydrofolate dehydrogenase/methenyltetrahydrofolate cyclohydrolase FolD [Candidatus Aminicenantes bacterium]|jgi:methylenetetrahydrofolate dehydrogenase (NADP+)/methenyltetrahydrofolate cyclohydrolase|nr:bifunctional methylenetetrahydrofolate dehydrogenase/methenyltetrahydrofolate cyclohydrolase FolD [Candidatus Aminicenantes bacterium]
MGSWLEGKTLAKKIKEKVKNDVALYLKQEKEVPGLAAILVGENRASKIYLRTKERNCERLGIHSEIICLPKDIETSLLKAKIEELNSREDVDSILVQLPLPSSFNAPEIIASIHPEKDVDGVHPFNLGNLMMNQEGLKPCTPLGIIELLKSREIPIAGKRVVIIGRSRLVGKPLAAMVTNENGTVTICHSKTENLPQVSAEADILVGAIGRGAFITPEFVKPGAVVVDVGMNNLTDKSKVEQMFGQDEKRLNDLREKGYTLIGDVHPQVIDKAEFLTPVPGGVGPLTVAMLMRNTLEAFKQRRNLA